jgi:hypothetical protein
MAPDITQVRVLLIMAPPEFGKSTCLVELEPTYLRYSAEVFDGSLLEVLDGARAAYDQGTHQMTC